MGDTRITRIDLEDAAEWSRPGGVSLILFAKRREDTRAEWEQGLVAAVFRDRSHEQRLPRVIAASSKQMHGGSSIEGRPDGRFKPFGREDSEYVADAIRRAASRAGTELDHLVLLQPDGLAPVIRLRVADPASFLRERYGLFLELLHRDTGRYEGRFLEIVDGKRRPVLRGFGVSRSHWGGNWVRQRYSGCARFSLSTPITFSPPPCPAD